MADKKVTFTKKEALPKKRYKKPVLHRVVLKLTELGFAVSTSPE